MTTTATKSNSIKAFSAAVALVAATTAAPAFAGQETNGTRFNGVSMNGLEVNGLGWNGGGVPLTIKIVRVTLPEESTSPVK